MYSAIQILVRRCLWLTASLPGSELLRKRTVHFCNAPGFHRTQPIVAIKFPKARFLRGNWSEGKWRTVFCFVLCSRHFLYWGSQAIFPRSCWRVCPGIKSKTTPDMILCAFRVLDHLIVTDLGPERLKQPTQCRTVESARSTI